MPSVVTPLGHAATDPRGYVGLVTRAVALVVDAVVIDLIALLIGGAVSLVAGALGSGTRINAVEAIIGGFAWFLWSGAYFVAFWTLTGQTPGNRLMGITVMRADGGGIGISRASRRFIGLILAALPLGAGFIRVLFDDRRRGFHDRLAGTVVRWDESRYPEPARPEPQPSPLEIQSALLPGPGDREPSQGLSTRPYPGG
ncbi:MAG: RDD family protein [Solirubrobacteraceae bacterium]